MCGCGWNSKHVPNHSYVSQGSSETCVYFELFRSSWQQKRLEPASSSSRGSQSVQLVLQSFFLSLFQKSTGHVHRVSTESFFTSCDFASCLTTQSPSDEVSWAGIWLCPVSSTYQHLTGASPPSMRSPQTSPRSRKTGV